jgi:hypothetical protein
MDLVAALVAAIAAVASAVLAYRSHRREAEVRAQADATSFALSELAGEVTRAAPRFIGDKPVPDPPPALVIACREGDCVLFVGTGFTAATGQPTWREALLQVLARWQEREPDNDIWRRLSDQARTEDYDLLADLLEARLGRFEMLEMLREAAGAKPRALPAEYRALAGIPFAGVLANTWSDVSSSIVTAERVTRLTPDATEDFTRALREPDPFIADVFGRLEDQSLLLTADAFRAHLEQNPAYARFLTFVCTTRSVLFLGVGVRGIEDFFTAIGLRRANRRQRAHYALVPWTAEAELRNDRVRERFNVQLLLYDATPGHPQLPEFCQALVAEVKKQPAPRIRRSHAPPPLSRVALRNVGPFEQLELSLEDSWNLLLGNNGCGKSTVLRAIALALCGDDDRAAAAAGRVLRSGAADGSIELWFGDTAFQTRLVRDGPRVRVTPEQVSPVEAGTWLAMAFPPLRGASTRAPKVPTAELAPAGPTVDDVLPMVTGVTDERLDDIKQWIVNEFWAKDTPSRRGKRRLDKAPKSVDAFFEIVSALTPGVHYSFRELDWRTLEVLVDTVDGPIPLELLSQGIGSVLSWTGPLITRVEEMRRQESSGTRLGVVLVDEIDAHLHPSWQRHLIPALTKQFDDLQFVATTHSPLVVGSVKEGALWALERRRDGTIAKERLEPAFEGWRADQILTSNAFDLPLAQDEATERRLKDYWNLRTKPNPTAEDQRRAEAMARELDLALPPPEDSPIKMRAATIVREWYAREARAGTEEEKRRLLAETEEFLARMRRGR